MQRVVSFYEKLPRGAAPEAKAKGLLGRYQAKYFGKKTSVQRMFPHALHPFRNGSIIDTHLAVIHALVLLIGIGYAQNYYFHLRKLTLEVDSRLGMQAIANCYL